jgi:transglutaminase-like putative cysteine protease
MPPLTIRHLTTYRYRKPVAFGEHRMMLRPRDCHGQKVVAARLGITPEPASLRFINDAFGNHVAIAEFAGSAAELSFESLVDVEHSPSAASEASSSTGSDQDDQRPLHPDPEGEIGRWARKFLVDANDSDALAFFTRLTRGINKGFVYRRRDAKGIQTPLQTLQLGRGTCRDFALLMVEAARALGFAARFASGYLVAELDGLTQPHDRMAVNGGTSDGATHAWAQVRIPGTGWVDFDPTAGTVGNASLITVAVVRDPADALPLYGTYAGAASDLLGMDVRVSVVPGGA